MPRGECCWFGPGSWPWAKFTIGIVQVVLTVAMLLLAKYRLTSMAAVQEHGKLTYTSTCFMASQDDWPSACTYAGVVAYMSLLLSFIMSVLQCCATSKMSGRKQCPRSLQLSQTLLPFLALLWWTAAACVLQYYSTRAAAAGIAQATQRSIVIACCWGSMGLFALVSLGELLCLKPQQTQAFTSPAAVQMVIPMQSYATPYFAAPPPAAGAPVVAAAAAVAVAASVPPQRTATAPIGAGIRYAAAQQQQFTVQQQQQHQPHAAQVPLAGVVVGIPCAPAAPVPPVQPPYAVMQSLAQTGVGAGAFQMALLEGAYRPGAQIVPFQPQLPDGWVNPARTASTPARVRVVNPDT